MEKMNNLQDMIMETGSLFAGIQTTQGGKTLKELKLEVYAPKSDFGKWLENLINNTIKNTKLKDVRNEFDPLLKIVTENDYLIPLVQKETERLFKIHFGTEKMKSNDFLDKVMKDSKVSKLCVIAKQNGIGEIEVETVKLIAFKNVLVKNGFKLIEIK